MNGKDEITLRLPNREVRITLQRSPRRKRTQLSVHRSGEVTLKTTLRVSRAELERFIAARADWIAATLAKVEALKPVKKPDGMRFLGQLYPLAVATSALLRKKGFCEFDGSTFYVHIPAALTPAKARAAQVQSLKQWYQVHAAEMIKSRADFYAEKIGITYKSIKFSDPKSRWGSCGSDGRLMFSWRAVMLAPDVLDYLIVHELCHIVHFNHSPAYWRLVEHVLPDYKHLRKALRDAEAEVAAAF